jgi:hypothetical protein
MEDNIKMHLKEIGVRCGLVSPGSGNGLVAEYCENSNEPFGSHKRRNISYQAEELLTFEGLCFMRYLIIILT